MLHNVTSLRACQAVLHSVLPLAFSLDSCDHADMSVSMTLPTRKTRTRKQALAMRPMRKRAQGETVALTVRVPRADWLRLHSLAAVEGVSLQSLGLLGLSRVLVEYGQPPIEW